MEDLPKCIICKRLLELNKNNKIKYQKQVIWDSWNAYWVHKKCQEYAEKEIFLKQLATLQNFKK